MTRSTGVYAEGARAHNPCSVGFSYLAIESSRKAMLGTFREHHMVPLPATYQLN